MTIWKYELEITDRQVINMPAHAAVLCVQMQYGKPCLWAQVNQNDSKIDRVFEIYAPGHPMETGVLRGYIGTIQTGSLVFHVFEKFPL